MAIRPRLPSWQRRALIEAHGYTCSYCAAQGDRWGVNGGDWHVDHISPRAAGGLLIESNLTLACALCNSLKGSYRLAVLPDELRRLRDHLDAMLANQERWPVECDEKA